MINDKYLLGVKAFLFGKFRHIIVRQTLHTLSVETSLTHLLVIIIIDCAGAVGGVVVIVALNTGGASADGLHTGRRAVSHAAHVSGDQRRDYNTTSKYNFRK